MEKKNLDWANIGFEYVQTDKRYVANYKDGKWDEGTLTEDANIVMNECAGVLQYAQTVFEGMKAYTTEDGRIVTFRPDLNAARMVDSANVWKCRSFRKTDLLMQSCRRFRQMPLMFRLMVQALHYISDHICLGLIL